MRLMPLLTMPLPTPAFLAMASARVRGLGLAIAVGIATGSGAIALSPAAKAQSLREPPPSAREVAEACASGRAATLPSPYRDVSPDHWAYGAVVTMYYCGAYRGAISPERYLQLREGRSREARPAPETGSDRPTERLPGDDRP